MFAYIPNPYGKGELPKNGGQGWLQVRGELPNSRIFLPMFLKVKLDSTPKYGDKNRDYFTIMEGVHKNKKASVSKIKVEENCKSFLFIEYGCQIRHDSRLLKSVPMTGPCLVQYRKVKPTSTGFKAITEHTNLSVGLFNVDKFSPAISDLEVIHQFDLIKPNRYKLKIPGYEHVIKAKKYLTESPFATTWYMIDEPLYIDDPATKSTDE